MLVTWRKWRSRINVSIEGEHLVDLKLPHPACLQVSQWLVFRPCRRLTMWLICCFLTDEWLLQKLSILKGQKVCVCICVC